MDGVDKWLMSVNILIGSFVLRLINAFEMHELSIFN